MYGVGRLEDRLFPLTSTETTPISTAVSDARTPSFQIGGTVSLTNTPVNNSMITNSNTHDG